MLELVTVRRTSLCIPTNRLSVPFRNTIRGCRQQPFCRRSWPQGSYSLLPWTSWRTFLRVGHAQCPRQSSWEYAPRTIHRWYKWVSTPRPHILFSPFSLPMYPSYSHRPSPINIFYSTRSFPPSSELTISSRKPSQELLSIHFPERSFCTSHSWATEGIGVCCRGHVGEISEEVETEESCRGQRWDRTCEWGSLRPFL